MRTRKRETGCVPEKENLVAYQKKRNLVVYQKRNLVVYQNKKRNRLRTRCRLIMRRDSGCVPRID